MRNVEVRKRISVSGIFQGGGFRPHVYRLGCRYGLDGYVRNTASGVMIEVQGPDATLNEFVKYLEFEAPPLARITSLCVEETTCLSETGFAIFSSGCFALVIMDRVTVKLGYRANVGKGRVVSDPIAISASPDSTISQIVVGFP